MEAGPSKPTRLRAYKACENCRLRKIKCSGETPCRSCAASDIAEHCFVRVKAKPNRAPAKILDLGADRVASSSSPTSHAAEGLPRRVVGDSLSPSTFVNAGRAASEASFAPPFRFAYDSPDQLAVSAQYSPAGAAADPHARGHSQATAMTAHATQRSTVASRQSTSWQVDLTPSPQAGPNSTSPAGPPLAVAESQFEAPSHSGANIRHHPLAVLEDSLSGWCQSNAKVDPPPLPTGQLLVEFEDDLMRSLIAAEDLDRLEVLDCPRLLNLYSRYRALPQTLTDDQTALVLASLCMARFTQLRGGVASGMKEPRTLAREDVTYYRMARKALSDWGRASITSMWALYCLVTYVQINGGAGEHGEILGLMAWQVQALGLHRRETAQLYPAHELGAPLLFAYCYAETFRAIMTDLSPAIPIVELELGAEYELRGPNAGIGRAHSHAVNYLRDYANTDIDISTAGYLAQAEEAWSIDLDELRAQPAVDYAKVKRGWAEMRIHWLRLLLHLPRMTLSPGRSSQATIYVARSAINIINTHSEAAFMGKLDPSWPQYKRIITCGQVLILCCARGEILPMEGVDLFARLIALLEAHLDFWPSSAEAIRGYRDAAARLGITIAYGQNAPTAAGEIPVFPPLQLNDDAAGWFLGMDMGMFALDADGNALW